MPKKSVRMPLLEAEKAGMSRVIALMNNKGGCGKTTTAMALGMYLARTGHNVLFWDNDPQCNLTQRLGMPDDDLQEYRLDRMFQYPKERPDVSKIAEYPYLQRIPGSDSKPGRVGVMPGSHFSETYANSLNGLFTGHGREFKNMVNSNDVFDFFSDRLNYYKQYYDFVVMDTAPAMEGNILNRMALRCSNEIIMPIDGLEAAFGIRQLLNWIESESAPMETKPNGMFVMVKYQLDTKNVGDFSTDKISRNSVFRVIKNALGDFVCDNGVRELRTLRHSTKGIPGFGGKTEYTALCEEVVNKIGMNRRNMFEYVYANGVIKDIEDGLAVIEKKVRKRKPRFYPVKYESVEQPLESYDVQR